MLATWMRDVYRGHEREMLWTAIDDLVSPLDTYGFASAGVYVFFDPKSHQVLYIGLAVDLAQRFAQHNGLIGFPDAGCKRRQIDNWFEQHEELGYAIFVQSPIDQVSVSRQRGTGSESFYDEEANTFWDYPRFGLDNIRRTEGILLSSHRKALSALPPWNKVGGAKHPPELATPGGYRLLELAAGRTDSLLLARKSIRDLSDDHNATAYETALHTGRIGAIQYNFGLEIDSLTVWRYFSDRAKDPRLQGSVLLDTALRLQADEYPLLPPPPPGSADTPGQLVVMPQAITRL